MPPVQVSDVILGDPPVQALCAKLTGGKTPIAASGLWGSSAPILAGLIANKLDQPLLYVVAHGDQADDAVDDMETILGTTPTLFPAWETLPGEGAGASEISAERARLCAALIEAKGGLSTTHPTSSGESHADASVGMAPGQARQASPLNEGYGPIIIAPIQALMQPVPTPASLEAHTITLRVGDTRDPESLARELIDRGFERLDQVEEPGDFALRGGILDIFWSPDIDPARIEFFGDQVESIRRFEV